MRWFNRGDKLKAADLQELKRTTDAVDGMKAGRNTKLSRTAAGITIASNGEQPKQAVVLGSRELASVQGTQNTDLWTLGGSTKGCRWQDYTNLYYNDTTGKLMGYRRTITIDVTGRVVKVSAEGTAVEIVAFVECEAQP